METLPHQVDWYLRLPAETVALTLPRRGRRHKRRRMNSDSDLSDRAAFSQGLMSR